MVKMAVLIILGVLQCTLQQPNEQVPIKQGNEVDPTREDLQDLLPGNECGHYVQNRIIGGQNASMMEFPWLALLGYRGPHGPDFHCMGTLINARYVLTGATCVYARKPYFVRLGEHTIGQDKDCNVNDASDCAPPVQDRDIEYAVRHQSYDTRSKQNDIALIRLKEEITFEDHIQPICLPVTTELRNNNPAEYIIAGWGKTEQFGEISETLQKATVPAVPDRDECQRQFEASGRITINDGHLCAGVDGGADTCNGDSGGPLGYPAQLNGIRFVQYGIVSFGRGCARGPSVYTNVAKYIDWIVANMEP
uniref:limulus clotting factor C n=2 Tax=Culex tarsalis TaxID=7177 RepID=A0A1Q3FMH9_CULTA